MIGTLLLGACSGGDEDKAAAPSAPTRAAVEDLVEETQRSASPGLEIGSATCPDRIPSIRGASFVCAVDIGGVSASYVVRVTGIKGDTGQFSLEPEKAIIDVARVVDLVEAEASTRSAGVPAEADCGPARVALLDVGQVLDCTVRQGDSTTRVQAKVRDKQGRIQFVYP